MVKKKTDEDANGSKAAYVRPPPEKTTELQHDEKPPLESIVNLHDFEKVASNVLDEKTWAFYSSAATDCITRDANNAMFNRIWWRPRILRDVRHVSTESKMMGHRTNMPLFVSPAALAKMIHPEGEKALARACAAQGIAQGVSSTCCCPREETLPDLPVRFPPTRLSQ